MTTVAANFTSVALAGPRRGLATVMASGVAVFVLAAGALSLATAPAGPPVLTPSIDVVVSSDAGSSMGVVAAPTDVVAEIPAALPSYYSFQWAEACEEECPSRVAAD